MGVALAILAIYLMFQLNRGGNNGMFTKFKAMWFEAQYGEGAVVKPLQDCGRPRSGYHLRVKFKSRFLRRNKDNVAVVRVPKEFMAASETVQDAVLIEILARDGISAGSIDSIEEAGEAPLKEPEQPAPP